MTAAQGAKIFVVVRGLVLAGICFGWAYYVHQEAIRNRTLPAADLNTGILCIAGFFGLLSIFHEPATVTRTPPPNPPTTEEK